MERLHTVILAACFSLAAAGCGEATDEHKANECPAGPICGSACCTADQVCNSATNTCEPKQSGACNPACAGETPVCSNGTCRCDDTSCGSGKRCDAAGQCEATSGCTPGCSGELPKCDNGTCKCEGNSCGEGKTCNAAGECAAVVADCTPPCSGETPVCTDGTCKCDQGSCGTGKTCTAFGMCVILPSACDPISQADCPPGMACYPDDLGGTRCVAPGTTAVPGQCHDFSDCAPGAGCLNNGYPGYCVTLCDRAAATSRCASTEECIAAGDALGYCAPRECNPLDATSCSGATSCYYNEPTFSYACLPPGTAQTGDACAKDSDCVAGDTCARTCAPFCNPRSSTNTCTGDWACEDFGDGVGYCKAPCDPIRQTGCPTGLACYPTGEDGDCLTPGTVAIGGSCQATGDCVPGAICLDPGVCAALCDPGSSTSPCAGSDACNTLGVVGLGYCGARECNPMTQTGCSTGACFFDWGAAEFTCHAGGTGVTGDDCLEDWDCAPGLGCWGEGWTCTPYCNLSSSTNPCDGTTCQMEPFAGVGVCR